MSNLSYTDELDRIYLSDEQIKTLDARLSRIHGQVGGLKRMLAENRDCDDILTQLSSVDAALQKVALLLLQGHFEVCVAAALRSGTDDPSVQRFKTSLARTVR